MDVQFFVSCKEVGLMIYILKSFSCKQFTIYFFSSRGMEGLIGAENMISGAKKKLWPGQLLVVQDPKRALLMLFVQADQLRRIQFSLD
jgi:hypothetical protein